MKEYTIWDKDATRYDVEDIHGLISEVHPIDLQEIYVATYRNIFTEQRYKKLFDEGTMKVLPNGEVNFEAAAEALKFIGEALCKELGEESFTQLENEIQKQWSELNSGE